MDIARFTADFGYFNYKLQETTYHKVNVGGILIGEKNDKGWNESHCKGMKNACEKNDCELIFEESVPETSVVIYDNQKILRCEEGETISDEELLTGMEWFVEGVEIWK